MTTQLNHQIDHPYVAPHRIPPLPPELWIAIAEFFEPAELEKLIDVNRDFFELMINARYQTREAWVSDDCPEPSVTLIMNIAWRHAGYSARVRVLHIWSFTTWHAIGATQINTSYVKPIKRGKPRFLRAFGKIIGFKSIEAEPSNAVVAEPFIMPAKHRITQWYQLPTNSSTSTSHASHYSTYLCGQLWAPCSNLRSFYLDLSPYAIRDAGTLSLFVGKFWSYKTLAFALAKRALTSSIPVPSSCSLPLSTNDLSCTVKSLAIAIYGLLDLSLLCQNLGSYTTSDLIWPFSSSFSCRDRKPVPSMFVGVSLKGPKKLELGLNHPHWVHQQSRNTSKAFCQALTLLTIMEHRLSYQEVKMVINSLFTLSIRTLGLFTLNMGPDLFDLLARKCRSLNRLVLNIIDHVCLAEGP
ncbi:hypothetical protein Hypma_010848 [Hypsizygus marmoreus]|uniref:F-box domain-containing protein n=1 Tax=Hypsizygus marmoreus TaxID=39966 RepID=A0A369JRC8_HYPMA|nr:hypothetical protein Hypma_010848 [Hypsizygus marmoreus]